MKRFPIFLLLGLALFACGGTAPKAAQPSTTAPTSITPSAPSPSPPTTTAAAPSTTATPADVAIDALAVKLVPLGCTVQPSDPTSSLSFGQINPAKELTCTIDGENVSLDQYVNADQVKHNQDLLKSAVVCQMVKGFGVTGPLYNIVGDKWTVNATTKATTEKILTALGTGKLVETKLSC